VFRQGLSAIATIAERPALDAGKNSAAATSLGAAEDVIYIYGVGQNPEFMCGAENMFVNK
jgi:hypothetical protein